MAATLLPYLIVLAVVGVHLTGMAMAHGQGWVVAGISTFTVIIVPVQFWSARAQLSGAWIELMVAREAAEEREQAAQAANRAKSQFLSNMSHELRTPLNGVLGMAQVLEAGSLTDRQRTGVQVIRQSGESLLSVLNDLLDLSKVETSAPELEIVEFDLDLMVRGVAAAFQPAAAAKGLTFEVEVAPPASGRFRGDSARIRRILYSLADNAVKFTEAGGVRIVGDR